MLRLKASAESFLKSAEHNFPHKQQRPRDSSEPGGVCFVCNALRPYCKAIFTCPMGKLHMRQHISHDRRSYFTAQPCSAESRISLRSPNCALPRRAQRTAAANQLCGDRSVFLLNLLRPRASALAGAYAAQRSRRPCGSPHDCPAAPCAGSACRRSPRRRQRSHPHLGSSGRWRARRFR